MSFPDFTQAGLDEEDANGERLYVCVCVCLWLSSNLDLMQFHKRYVSYSLLRRCDL